MRPNSRLMIFVLFLIATLVPFAAWSEEPAAARSEALLRQHLDKLEKALRRSAREDDAAALLRHVRQLRGRVPNPDSVEGRKLLEEMRSLALRAGSLSAAETKESPRNAESVGTIGGSVTEAVGGAPVADALITIWTGDGDTPVLFTASDGSGRYAAEVAAGTYRATARSPGDLIDEIYGGGVCLETSFCLPSTGALIEVTAGEVTGGIDFGLDLGGTITGTVSDASTGEPLADVGVTIFDDVDIFDVAFAFTDEAGVFAVTGLPAGTYFVATESFFGYLDEVWDDVPCPGGPFSGLCEPDTGTPIAVAADSTVAGVDFALDRLGAISGTVTAAADGMPIPFVDVEVFNDQGDRISFGFSDENGVYTSPGLPAGTYFAVTQNFSGFREELWDDIPCPGGSFVGCDPTAGDPIEVTLNATTPDVDFALRSLGRISGSVTDEATQPIPDVEISVWDDLGRLVLSLTTQPSGDYETDGLESGTYFVATGNSAGYLDEVWDDVPCPVLDLDRQCDVTAGAPIAVTLDSTVSDVDFALALGGAIEGTVTAADTGEPIPSFEVEIFDETGTRVDEQFTDETGSYVSRGLPEGTYFARSVDFFSSFTGEIYDGIPCTFAQCVPTSGDPIAVTLGNTTGAIDFELDRLGSISGSVTDEDSGQPLAGVELMVYDDDGNFVDFFFSDPDGGYRAENLQPGTYFVQTLSFSGYADELYDDIPCPGPACVPVDGTPIQVELNSTASGVDFALTLRRGIRGTVTDESSGQPLPDVAVDVWDDSAFLLGRVLTDSEGRYTVGFEEQGVYFVSTDNGRGAVDEVYDDVACPDGPAGDGLCDPLTGTPIVINTSTVREDIDFALAGAACVETDTALCLNQSRFRVEVAWQTPNGSRGSGRAVELTSETGYFWFFSADNVELVIKVLDGCFEPFNTFWVFAAGLTNVATELTVTDTLTGAVKTYVNPLGTAFEPVLDTGAFDTCTAADASTAGELAKALPEIVRELGIRDKGTCAAGATELCLNQDRFLVEAFWETPNGNTGEGRAVTLTDDTGYFWFFSADNVEVVVKVLDACDLGPFNNFWVFAAGLTNVEVTLRVTDLGSGEVKEYFNPLGSAFEPVLDTDAFDTCPQS